MACEKPGATVIALMYYALQRSGGMARPAPRWVSLTRGALRLALRNTQDMDTHRRGRDGRRANFDPDQTVRFAQSGRSTLKV